MKIRPARDEDQAFILDSFTREYMQCPYSGGVSFGTIRGLMFDLLASTNWHTLVACDDEIDSEIMGYVVFRDNVTVAWVHVKELYRRKGFLTGATLMLSALGASWGDRAINCPFLPPNVLRFAASRGIKLRFRPYLVFSK